jgi:hypothetical protein
VLITCRDSSIPFGEFSALSTILTSLVWSQVRDLGPVINLLYGGGSSVTFKDRKSRPLGKSTRDAFAIAR